VETVVADGNVETYACSAAEFRGLFTSSTDVDAFEQMQRAEVKNFIMDPCEGAPFGKPLRYGCFSTVEVNVAQATGLFETSKSASMRSRLKKKGQGSECATWAVVDLVDKATGKPFSRVLWRHQTARAALKAAAGSNSKLHEDDGATKPKWGEKLKWEDITARFNRQALRVRVYCCDEKGQDRVLGKVLIDVHNLEQEPNKDERGFIAGWYELCQLGANETRVPSATNTPGKKNFFVLQDHDFTNRTDEDLVDGHGSFIQLQLKVVRAEREALPKKKDRAWLIAQEKMLKGTMGVADIVELQMLRAQSLTQKKIDLS
jgi:hypothetical protein